MKHDRNPAAVVLLAIGLVAAAPCKPAGPPVGRWTYDNGLPAGMPQPTSSITLDGNRIIVETFLADRAFTSRTERYDATTLGLLSADSHASCCGNEWTASLTRGIDGAYEVVSSSSGPARLNPASEPVVLDAANPLLPWIYQRTHSREVELVSLPGLATSSASVRALHLAISDDRAPAGVPSRDWGLHISDDSAVRTIWYDPCTFAVDAIEEVGSLLLRR